MISEGQCRRCPAKILMIPHNRTGNPAPIEALPSPDGNIIIDRERGVYIILTKGELTNARERGHSLHKNHFATCEFARSFAARVKARKEIKKRSAAA